MGGSSQHVNCQVARSARFSRTLTATTGIYKSVCIMNITLGCIQKCHATGCVCSVLYSAYCMLVTHRSSTVYKTCTPTLANCYTNGACYLIRSDRAFELHGSDRVTFDVTAERIENGVA